MTATITESHSLFQIDAELDELMEEIQEQVDANGEAAEALLTRFHRFCEMHGEKVDRIGRFLRMMEAREQYCRSEASRLEDRARSAANKVKRTKAMVLFYLMSRDLRKIEGREFTLKVQKNSQDSVTITDDSAVPIAYRKVEARIDGVLWETVLSYVPDDLAKMLTGSIQELRTDTDAIKAAALRQEPVPGAEVRRGSHLRVA